ncbi:MAG TPA: arginine--tRNA ligase, partial [Verrucomicrobiae bacterium]|nr:arginine--tRNA ligase [Verrucomicrobiae bacterium]
MTGAVREQLEDALIKAVRALGVDGDLPDLELGRAKAAERGEYASSAGLKLARVLKQPPAQIAGRLAETIVVPDGAATVEAVGGYVNFRFAPQW